MTSKFPKEGILKSTQRRKWQKDGRKGKLGTYFVLGIKGI